MTAAALLREARALVDRPGAELAGVWPRAAALTARRAIERALDDLWAVRAPGLERASGRAQLACLATYLRAPELAGEVAYTWAALSAACHHHAYELGPTAAELRARFEVVERLLERVAVVTRAT